MPTPPSRAPAMALEPVVGPVDSVPGCHRIDEAPGIGSSAHQRRGAADSMICPRGRADA